MPETQFFETWPDRIEYEVNRQFGGEATVRDIVHIMFHLGWTPPTITPPPAE
jgi:hypothetical protein